MVEEITRPRLLTEADQGVAYGWFHLVSGLMLVPASVAFGWLWEKAGVAVARTTTTKDLIVRVITPRFLNEGDQVVLPTIAHVMGAPPAPFLPEDRVCQPMAMVLVTVTIVACWIPAPWQATSGGADVCWRSSSPSSACSSLAR